MASGAGHPYTPIMVGRGYVLCASVAGSHHASQLPPVTAAVHPRPHVVRHAAHRASPTCPLESAAMRPRRVPTARDISPTDTLSSYRIWPVNATGNTLVA